MGLRRGRHGPHLVRDRRGGARRGRGARGRRSRRARSVPGEGVELEGGEMHPGPVVVSNADPKRHARAVRRRGAGDVPVQRVDGWRIESPVREGELRAQPPADVDGRARTPTTRAARRCRSRCRSTTRRPAFEACTRGVPSPGFAELYFQTAYDPTVAPAGKHTMSVFVQYAPVRARRRRPGTTRRDEIGRMVLDLIARFAPDIQTCVEEMDVLGPPDIEARVGLTGGHIFQGECTARPDVARTGFAPRTADARRLPLRRRDAPGGQRHRAQRPQRGDGRPRRPARLTTRRRHRVDVPVGVVVVGVDVAEVS